MGSESGYAGVPIDLYSDTIYEALGDFDVSSSDNDSDTDKVGELNDNENTGIDNSVSEDEDSDSEDSDSEDSDSEDSDSEVSDSENTDINDDESSNELESIDRVKKNFGDNESNSSEEDDDESNSSEYSDNDDSDYSSEGMGANIINSSGVNIGANTNIETGSNDTDIDIDLEDLSGLGGKNYLNPELTKGCDDDDDDDDDTRLHPEKLEMLEKSEKIREFLKDDYLREIILGVDNAARNNVRNVEMILDNGRKSDEMFYNFTEEILNIMYGTPKMDF